MDTMANTEKFEDVKTIIPAPPGTKFRRTLKDGRYLLMDVVAIALCRHVDGTAGFIPVLNHGDYIDFAHWYGEIITEEQKCFLPEDYVRPEDFEI